jgi:hypothetical protein
MHLKILKFKCLKFTSFPKTKYDISKLDVFKKPMVYFKAPIFIFDLDIFLIYLHLLLWNRTFTCTYFHSQWFYLTFDYICFYHIFSHQEPY